ncbi:MAG: hypothetical protein WCJ39_08385 [bacterium]
MGFGFIFGFWIRGLIIHGRYKTHEQIRMIKRVTKRISELISEGELDMARVKIRKFSLSALSCNQKSFALFTDTQPFVQIADIVGDYKANLVNWMTASTNNDDTIGMVLHQPTEKKPIEYYAEKINNILLRHFNLV